MAAVGPVLDFPAGALPVLLERVVALHEHLELEATGGVADLFPAQQPKSAVDVLARHRGLDALHAHEVLLIQSPEAFQAYL
jgi:hypothetical protein